VSSRRATTPRWTPTATSEPGEDEPLSIVATHQIVNRAPCESSVSRARGSHLPARFASERLRGPHVVRLAVVPASSRCRRPSACAPGASRPRVAMRLVPRSRAVVVRPYDPAMSQRSPSSLVSLGDQRVLVAVRHRARGSSKPTDAPCHVDLPCRGTARPTPRRANLTARNPGNERRRSSQPLLDRPRTNAAPSKGRSAFCR